MRSIELFGTEVAPVVRTNRTAAGGDDRGRYVAGRSVAAEPTPPLGVAAIRSSIPCGVVPSHIARRSTVIVRASAAGADDRSRACAMNKPMQTYHRRFPLSSGSGTPAARAVRARYASTSPM